MASCSVKVIKWVARIAFVVLLLIQDFFLAAYPATYNNPIWYVLVLLFALAPFVGCYLILASKAELRWLFYVWGLYILALIVNIGIVFGVVGDSINKDKLLGPNALKLVLCITPLLLLLLLHTADDWEETDKHRELVSKLSFYMAIDLFDVVDMIDIVLEEYEHDIGIPKGFGTAMIVVACYTLLLSPWQMAENKLTEEDAPKIRFRTAVFRNIVEIVLVNLPFFVIRAVVFFQYGKDESIFIAKNGIAIVLSLLDIRHLCSSDSD
ncbi:hypothetical protein OS493_029409 [Desmophyllum pertusum]|uniref:Uncharacterized protein n=1 Tax=Desmophyllum pertusum TaxID=174260 RepID=A0A9W9YWS7_9CNID|nr:hypothetical protein OS493_029409 [Desmophyllum pertusum]